MRQPSCSTESVCSQPAQEWVVHALGRRRAPERGADLRVVEEVEEQRADVRVLHLHDQRAHLREQRVGVEAGGGQEVLCPHFGGDQLAERVDLELQLAVPERGGALYLDEIAGGEARVVLLGIVPEARLDLAAPVAQREREVWLSALAGGQRLPRDQEDRAHALPVAQVLQERLFVGHAGDVARGSDSLGYSSAASSSSVAGALPFFFAASAARISSAGRGSSV